MKTLVPGQSKAHSSRRAVLVALAAATTMATVVIGAGSAFAMTLDEARSRGLVGERLDGYVGVVSNASGVQELVSSVNSQRRAQYERTAAETGRTRAEVEAVAGRSLLERAQPGWYVMAPDGSWRQK